VPDGSAAYEEVMLAAFADIHIQWRDAAEEVPGFSADADVAE
jgi:hypothetical protein